MNHCRHWKAAAVWILFHRSPSLVSSLSPLVPSSSNPHTLPIRSLSAWSSLQAVNNNNNISNNNNNENENYESMIVRVRSNIGTVRLTIENDDGKATGSTVLTKLLEELRIKTDSTYTLKQDLSFDPSGTRKIRKSQELSEQGIGHGCMVYCRVEEGTPSPSVDQETNDRDSIDCNSVTKKMTETAGETKNDRDVIDMIESSDDEEEVVCMGSQNSRGNDASDDDVQVVSPKSVKSKTRKRPRSPMDGRSSISSNKRKVGQTTTSSGFRIASYNVWFGPPDAEAKQVFPRERMEGIVNSLAGCGERETEALPLLFVGLQELTPSLVEYLAPHFRKLGYRLCTQPLGGFGPSYGIGIAIPENLVVLEQRFVPYQNSSQGRGFLFVRTHTTLFVTTHLESWCGPEFTGSSEREVQIAAAASFCQNQLNAGLGLELAIVAGDLNWDDERKRTTARGAPNRRLLWILPGPWRDAGTPFDYTYDSKENPMLSGNLRRRLDRCLYFTPQNDRGDGCSYQSEKLQKIGKESIPNLVWNKRNSYNDTIKKMPVAPSDHFGIVVPFVKKAF